MEKSYSKGLAQFFDSVRQSRGLTQEDFIFDIVSMRQYRRYLSGECKISQEVIRGFSERLKIKPEHIIMDYEASKVDESRMMINFYNSVANLDLKNAEHLKNTIRADHIQEPTNKMLYEHTLSFLDYQTNHISAAQFVQRNIDIVNYPEVMNYYKISGVELVLLGTLVNNPAFKDREVVAEKIKSILANPTIIIGDYNETLQFITIFTMAKYYGIREAYQTVIDLCKQGILELKRLRMYYMFDYFYYYLSLAYQALGDITSRDDALLRCYSVLLAEDNPSKLKKFTTMIEKDFKINFKAYMLDYMTKHA